MAKGYWDMEWTRRQGFDHAYDKRLYDRLREGHARRPVASIVSRDWIARTSWPAFWRTMTSRARLPVAIARLHAGLGRHRAAIRGFYLDVAPWQCHAFSITKIA